MSGLGASLIRWRGAVLGDEVRWRRAVLGLAALAFGVRLLVAAGTGGGEDLKLYHAFGGLVADGFNPYHPPPGFPLPDRFGDNLPLELLLFAGVLKVHDAAMSLRVLFAAADAGVILLIGLHYARPRAWRAAFVIFYAFNPLVLGSWTATSEDKTLLFLLFAATILAVERDRPAWSWAGTAVLTAIKGFGIALAPMLFVHTARRRGWRLALGCVAGYVAAVAIGHLPWFPDDLDAYSHRADRTNFPVPGHASLTQVLSRLDVYDPAVARLGVPILVVAIFVLFWRELIGIVEAMVLANAATLVLQPDHSYPRVLFATLPFLLILRTDRRRWLVLWAVSVLGSIAVYFQQERGELGGYSSFPHVLAANAFFFVVIAYYARDKFAGRGVTQPSPA